MNFKEDARPLSMVFLVLSLIVAGISDAFGYPFPQWFIAFALSYTGEWFIERGVRKTIGKE